MSSVAGEYDDREPLPGTVDSMPPPLVCRCLPASDACALLPRFQERGAVENLGERGGMWRRFAWICAGGAVRGGGRGQCRFVLNSESSSSSVNLLVLRFFLFVSELMKMPRLRFGRWKVIALPLFLPTFSSSVDKNVLVQ